MSFSNHESTLDNYCSLNQSDNIDIDFNYPQIKNCSATLTVPLPPQEQQDKEQLEQLEQQKDIDINSLIHNNNLFGNLNDPKDINITRRRNSSNEINNLDISETVNKFLKNSIDNTSTISATTTTSIVTPITIITPTTNLSTSTSSSNFHSYNNHSNSGYYNSSNRSISSISLNTSTSSRTSGFYLASPISSSSSLSDISNISNNSDMGALYNGIIGLIIDFSNRDLLKVPHRLPCDKDKIEGFNSSFNKISIIPDDFLIGFKCLTTLNFEYNKLKSIPKSIRSITTLQNIRLCNNKFKKFPKVLFQMPQLLTIDLSSNRIETLPKEINQLINLKELYLSNNQIEIVPLQISELTLFLFSIENNPIIYPPKDIIELGFEGLLDFIQNDTNYKQQSKLSLKQQQKSPNSSIISNSNSNNSLNIINNNNNSNSTTSSTSSSPTNERKSPTYNNNVGFLTYVNRSKPQQTQLQTPQHASTMTRVDSRLFSSKGDSMVIQSTPTAITNTYYTPKKVKPSKSSKSNRDIKNIMEIQLSLLQVSENKHQQQSGDVDSSNSTPNSNSQTTSPILERIKSKMLVSSSTISSSIKDNNSKKLKNNNNTQTIQQQPPIQEIEEEQQPQQPQQPQQQLENILTLPIIENINEYSKIVVIDSSNEFVIPLDESCTSNISINSSDEVYTIVQKEQQEQQQSQLIKQSSNDSLKTSTASFTPDDMSLDDSNNSIYSSISSSNVSVNSSNSPQPTSPLPNFINYNHNSLSNSGSGGSSNTKSKIVGHHHGRVLQSSKSSKSFFTNNTTTKLSSSKQQISTTSSSNSAIGSSQQVFQKMAYMLSFTKPVTKSLSVTPNAKNNQPSTPTTSTSNSNNIDNLVNKNDEINGIIESKTTDSEIFLLENIPHNGYRKRRGTISELDLKYDSEVTLTVGNNQQQHVKVINLIDIIRDEISREHFKSFLVTEFSEENLEFWLTVKRYKLLTDEERFDESESIYNQYICEGSINQLNLPNICVKRLRDGYQTLKNSVSLYDEAQQHIYKLMESDSFERFKKSNLFFKCQSPTSSNLKCNNLKQLLI